jgi:hypothetical protein
MPLMTISLTLARTPEFPNGSAGHGYEFVAPLTDDGHIDAAEWRSAKAHRTVRRFWGSEGDKSGMLRHVGQGWRFDYDDRDDADDEPFFKLDRHPLVPGVYVSVTEQDGVQRAFRVAAVAPA